MSRFDDRHRVPDADSLWIASDNERGGAQCAVRIIDTTPARAAALRMRIREASAVRHPSLARWVTLKEEDGQLIVAREWLPGPAFTGPMPAKDAVKIMVAVLDGLDVAHWHDLTHGRIAAERILRGEDNTPVLVDLGLEGQGTVAADLRAVADTLEAITSEMPHGLRSVIARAHEGVYTTAADLKLALELSLRPAAAPPVNWARRLFVASLCLPLGIAVWLCFGPQANGPDTVVVAEPVEVAPVEAAPVEDLPAVERAAVAPRGPRRPPVVEPDEPLPEPPVELPEPQPQTIVVAAPPQGPSAARVVVAPVEAPAAPAPPVPAPEAPAGVAIGKWHIDRSGGGSGVVLRLIAEHPVQDRLGRAGRPAVEVHCNGGKASLVLAPGVQSVERVMLENGLDSDLALVEATVDGRAVDGLRLKVDTGTALMHLPRRGAGWLLELHGARSVAFSYTPFASPAVVAEFDWTGFEAAWRQAGTCG
jgi:tRNA A-37 threonylcarbamoyl transferase component Bud32